jgi:hypothetical protein
LLNSQSTASEKASVAKQRKTARQRERRAEKRGKGERKTSKKAKFVIENEKEDAFEPFGEQKWRLRCHNGEQASNAAHQGIYPDLKRVNGALLQ